MMEELMKQGWYLTEEGFKVVSNSGSISHVSEMIKNALDIDLKEIGSGQGQLGQVDLVVQLQKMRNVSAPKNNEESKSVPRMLKLYLTDGKNNYQAVEIEHIPSLTLNTPPGTKIFLKAGSIGSSHGIILLKPSHIYRILGGKVSNLVEKWELNRKLAVYTRVRSCDEGGPPPWIPFGKTIKINDKDKQFKALSNDKDAGTADGNNINKDEFEAQRQDAIAEAARQGSKKVFGGGTKQLLDHSVQKIIDQGFTIEQAEYALRVNRNNVERALKSLQRNENRQNNSFQPREHQRGKRFEKKTDEMKPSSGKVSLFDFLEDKLPTQLVDTVQTNQFNNNYQSDKYSMDNQINTDGNFNKTGGKYYRGAVGGGASNSNRGASSQHSKRKNNENVDVSQYTGQNNQQGKPPRFQKNQYTYQQQQQQSNQSDNYNNFNDKKSKKISKPQINKNYNNLEVETSSSIALKQNSDNSCQYFQYNHNRREETTNHNDNKNYKNHHLNKYHNPNPVQQEHQQHQDQFFSTNNNMNKNVRNNNIDTNGIWIWKKGDQCMAKYWEDDKYYNAQVTAVSARTCVVQFKDFNNYEEVLQADCIPLTDNFPIIPQDNNRYQFDQTKHSTVEFRRGNNNSRGAFRKRGQHQQQRNVYRR